MSIDVARGRAHHCPGRLSPALPTRAWNAIRWASWRSRQAPTTASRRPGPSATSPSAAACRTRRWSGPPSRSRRRPRAPITPRAGCPTTWPARSSRPRTRSWAWRRTRIPCGQALQAELIDNFRVDPFQAGAGVSHNMNTNEVLANRAIELLGAARHRLRAARRLRRRQPQRPREHGAVDQRHLPHGDARGHARSDQGADRGAGRACCRVRRARRGLRRRAQVGPHAHAGRRADPPRAGVRRLCADDPPGARPDPPGRRGPGRAEHRGHGRRHRAQRRARVHRAGDQVPLRADRLPAAHGRAPGAGHPVDGADAGRLGGAARPGRGPGQDHGRPAADVVRAADRVSRRSACRPSSRARRSCRAR